MLGVHNNTTLVPVETRLLILFLFILVRNVKIVNTGEIRGSASLPSTTARKRTIHEVKSFKK